MPATVAPIGGKVYLYYVILNKLGGDAAPERCEERGGVVPVRDVAREPPAIAQRDSAAQSAALLTQEGSWHSRWAPRPYPRLRRQATIIPTPASLLWPA